uniref:F-box-like protein n=1 Tax=Marseillevirus LCMAC102 TaxID=2506603 RepID=A0A481YT54_9VIRU|nr:MAG: F-box-like protein [Marseillevirus LCMAC102]
MRKKKEPDSDKTVHDKIYNKDTKRWVLKTGVVGKRILAEQEALKKTARKEPVSKKKPKKKVKKGKLPSGFEKLPVEIIEQILLELDRKDLNSACKTNKRIAAICANNVFQKKYGKLHPKQIPTIVVYKKGPQSFFWSTETAEKFKDFRPNRKIKGVYEIPRNKVFVNKNSIKDILYYYFAANGIPQAVFRSQKKLKDYVNQKGLTLGKDVFCGNLANYWVAERG